MKKTLKILGLLLVMCTLGFGGFVGWKLYPHDDPKPLPSPLVSAYSEEGEMLLEGTNIRVDYAQLSKTFQPQSLVSYCGVASSVAVLNALEKSVSQGDFFTDDAAKIRPRLKVMFGGMSLPDLGGLLKAHGVRVTIHYADQSSVEEFRSTIEKNLATADDYLIVNYQRKALEQGEVGHISPLAAYDEGTDSVLIMDTAAHKYPPTWVPLEMLYAAMQTIDAATGKMRGYIEVSK